MVLITFLSLCLPEALSASLAGRLALCPCVNVLLENAWLSLFVSLSLSPFHSETFLIDFLIWESEVSLNKMRKEPVNRVVTKASLVTEEGEPAERRRNGGI